MNNNTSTNSTNNTNNDNTNNDKTNNTNKTDDKTSKNNDNKTSKNKNNYGIIPYIIVFAVLFIISLILLTWMLDVWYKSRTCQYNSEIWCSDNWICNTRAVDNGSGVFSTCPPNSSGENDGSINIYSNCFTSADKPGLASCLFGLTSYIETVCGGSGSTGEQKCGCPPADLYTDGTGSNNCLLNCDKPNDNCCCCPGQSGCQINVCDYCNSNPPEGLSDCFNIIRDPKQNTTCTVDCSGCSKVI
jgi:hypothetical protein